MLFKIVLSLILYNFHCELIYLSPDRFIKKQNSKKNNGRMNHLANLFYLLYLFYYPIS